MDFSFKVGLIRANIICSTLTNAWKSSNNLIKIIFGVNNLKGLKSIEGLSKSMKEYIKFGLYKRVLELKAGRRNVSVKAKGCTYL